MAVSQSIRTLKLSLLSDVSGFTQGLDTAKSGFDKFSDGVSKAARVSTGVIAALGGIAASSVQLASDLEETRNKVGEIFGPAGRKQLEEWAATANIALGQTRRQALDAAGTFAIFGRSAGLSGDDLFDFSTGLTELATDLASFNNTDVDTAITAIGAALRGESEPIRQFGVLLDDATLKAKALELGLIDTTNQALTPQQRVLAAYNEILGQTVTAQGDFERTSDGLANQAKIAKARIEDFRTELGNELLPVVADLLPLMQGFLDELAAADTEQIVNIGKAIAIVAGSLIVLNGALKVFSTLKAAWALLTTPLGALASVAGLVAGGSRLLANQLVPEGTEERLSFGRGTIGGTLDTSSTTSITVNGFVGSEVELGRALTSALDAYSRTGTTYTSGTFR